MTTTKPSHPIIIRLEPAAHGLVKLSIDRASREWSACVHPSNVKATLLAELSYLDLEGIANAMAAHGERG